MHSDPQIELKIAQAAAQRQWQVLGHVMLALAVVLAVFWPTLRSMIEIWNRSETFTHGWLVIPAFVWFTWERRHRLAAITLWPFWPGLIAVAGGGLTVVANAPNPAGVALLRHRFSDESVRPLGLLAGAALPTLVAAAGFRWL